MGGQPANTVSLGLQEGLNGSRWPPVPSIVANIRSTCYIVHVWCLLRPSGVTWSRLGGCPSRQLSGRCTTQGRLWPLNSVAEAHIGEIVRTPNPKTWVWYVLYGMVSGNYVWLCTMGGTCCTSTPTPDHSWAPWMFRRRGGEVPWASPKWVG